MATREAVIDATAQILAEVGEDALTTARIAERAGVSVGSIYQYFADKDAILMAIIRRERALVAAQIADHLAGAGEADLEELVARIVGAVLAVFRERRRQPRLVALALARLSREGFGADILDQVAALIVAAGEKRGEMISPLSAYVLTRAVMGAIRATVLEDNDVLDDPALGRELVVLAVAFLRSRAAAEGI